MLKILLTDDHSITRLGVSLILREMFPDVEVTEAYDEPSAVHQLKRQVFDMMIFDINMPGSDAAHLLQVAKDLYPGMKTMVFSMVSEKTHARHFLNLGADGFLNKDADNSTIKRAISQILKGDKYIPESIRGQMGQKKNQGEIIEKLSFRELEVLRRMMQGKSLTDISEEMKVHISTVSTYKTRIFQKLGVTNIMELREIPGLNL